MADELIVAVRDLSIWVTPNHDPDAIATDDVWANAVLVAASNLIRDEVGDPALLWTSPEATPSRARLIALRVAGRTYNNPDLIVQEGNVGPLGGDRYADAAALGTELSEQEREDLRKLAEKLNTGGSSGLWLQPIGNGDPIPDDTIYLFDDSGSDWAIPYGDGRDSWAFGDPT